MKRNCAPPLCRALKHSMMMRNVRKMSEHPKAVMNTTSEHVSVFLFAPTNRNRKSPQFSAANVPVASHIALGPLESFLEKSQEESQSLAIFHRTQNLKRKDIGRIWRVRNELLAKTSLGSLPCVRKFESQRNRITWCTQLPSQWE